MPLKIDNKGFARLSERAVTEVPLDGIKFPARGVESNGRNRGGSVGSIKY